MPLYEFRCRLCGYKFTIRMPIGTKETRCPECDGKTDKVVSKFSFRME